jgi:signal recognition particle subunit SRP19
MVSKGTDKFVIWPIYFEKDVSRANGRRVPKNLAINNPTVQDIFKIAQSLSLTPLIEKKSYPSLWWTSGRILVEKKGSKTEILRNIAQKLSQKQE